MYSVCCVYNELLGNHSGVIMHESVLEHCKHVVIIFALCTMSVCISHFLLTCLFEIAIPAAGLSAVTSARSLQVHDYTYVC